MGDTHNTDHLPAPFHRYILWSAAGEPVSAHTSGSSSNELASLTLYYSCVFAYVRAQNASIIALLAPASAVVLAAIILSQPITSSVLVGGGLILLKCSRGLWGRGWGGSGMSDHHAKPVCADRLDDLEPHSWQRHIFPLHKIAKLIK